MCINTDEKIYNNKFNNFMDCVWWFYILRYKKIPLQNLKLLLEICVDASYIDTTQLLVPSEINYVNTDEYKALVTKIKQQ